MQKQVFDVVGAPRGLKLVIDNDINVSKNDVTFSIHEDSNGKYVQVDNPVIQTEFNGKELAKILSEIA